MPGRAGAGPPGACDDQIMTNDRATSTRRPVVVFDGGCGFCRRQVRTIALLDWLGRLDQVPYDDAVQRWPEVARGTLGDGLRMRFPDATVTVGIDAVRSIAVRLPVTALPALLLWLPGIHPLADRAYRFVAARRRRDEACELPPQPPPR
jgi:predicted DCC family thiol-disulfide oxidoreductase YuxK